MARGPIQTQALLLRLHPNSQTLEPFLRPQGLSLGLYH